MSEAHGKAIPWPVNQRLTPFHRTENAHYATIVSILLIEDDIILLNTAGMLLRIRLSGNTGAGTG